MPLKFSSRKRGHMRLKVFAAFCLSLLFAAVCAVPGDSARAQRAPRRGQQTPPASNTAASQRERPKQVIIGRGADSSRGSRMTITSDNPLNDYSAYRSGDRFYVELPNANADTAARAAGKGYSDLQVQRRGKNVVLSYRVQPGARPRVEQRFNRLEVVFEAPEGEAARAAEQPQQPQPSPTAGNRNPGAQSQAAGQPAPPAANQNAAGDRRAPSAAAGAAAGQASAAQTPSPSAAPAAVVEQTTAAVPQPVPVEQSPSPVEQPPPAGGQSGVQELAQARPPETTAPVNTTNTVKGATGSGASLGAFLVRNWMMMLVAALLVTGIGLLIAARRSSTGPRPPAEARKAEAPPTLTETPAPRLGASGAAAPSAGAGAAAVAAAVAAATAAREAKKVSKKSKKKKSAGVVKEQEKTAGARLEEAPRSEEAARPAVAEPSAPSAAAEESAVEEVTVEESTPAENWAAAPAAFEESTPAETVEIAPFVAGGVSAAGDAPAEVADDEVTSEVAPEEVKGIEAVTTPEPEVETKEIAPAVAPDPERAQAETKRLLDGEIYDRGAIATRDVMARQMIASELLSALAGRNAGRSERARAAFVEYGYFEEKADDLRTAAASAERASAARALGLAADRAATPHLVAALEDDAVDVRRAAVESLASLRDPSAVAPLEALLRREKKSKTKVNRKLVEHAIQTCREGVAEAPAPAVAAAPLGAATETESPAETAVEPYVETSPSAESEVAAVGESAVAEVAAGPSAEAVTFDESAPDEATIVGEHAAVFVDAEEPSPSVEEATAEVVPYAAEEEITTHFPSVGPTTGPEETDAVAVAAGVAEWTPDETPTLAAEAETIEVAPPAEFAGMTPAFAAGFDEAAPAEAADESPSGHAPPAEVFAAEAQAVAEEEELTLAEAGGGQTEDWVEVDMSELGAAPSSEPADLHTFVFESSGGEPVAPHAPPAEQTFAHEPAAAEPSAFEPAAAEPRAARFTLEELPAEESRAEEAAAAAVAAERALISSTPGVEEKGVALFDEYSSVPANIQQRLASREPAERAEAVAELARVDTGEAFQQVCAAFDDEAKEVRSAAARALYDMHGDRADSFTRALREANSERRRQIGSAIASSGLAGEAISQLTGESREKTYEAFSLLFLMAKAGEVQPLVRAIEGHPNNEVRLAVVKLLALSGQKDILPAFRRLAVRGSLPTEVRSAVMEAIYQISSQSEATPAA